MNQTKLSSERQLPTRKSLLLNLNSALSASGGFFTSSIFWILLVLFMFELGLNVIKPMRFVKLEGIIFQDQDTLNNKVEYLFSQSNNRNIYLFGTSLIDYASCDADFVWQNSRRTSIERSEYHNAEYLDHRLHEKLSLTTQSLNLGVPGCLMSGQKLLLEKAIEKGKQPPVVILCVAPRTFIDKTKQEGLDNIDCCFKRRDFNITKGESLQSAVDNICNQNWRYFRQRADYATVFTTLVENYFNRPTNAYVAKSWKKKNLKFDASNEIYNPKMADDQESIKGNNVYYKLAYDNPDNEMFGRQIDSLTEFLQLCKKNDIYCLVVSMPLSQKNLTLLPEVFRQKFRNTIDQVCRQESVGHLFYMNDKRFSPPDFRDGVHLNGRGAIKFWNLLVDSIKEDKLLNAQLKQSILKVRQ